MKTRQLIHNFTKLQRISLSLPDYNSIFVIFSADPCHVYGFVEAVYDMVVFISGAGPHFPV